MKLTLFSILFCVAIYAASASKLLASSSRTLNRRENNLIRRLFKRQASNDPNCQRDRCAVPNCGKDFISTTLPGECCERCIPLEYAIAVGLVPRGPQAVQDNRNPTRPQEPQNPYPYNAPQAQSVDVYIYGPDEGARVSEGQSIYFDCEVISPYNQHAQPRWSRSGNQPLPYKVQSTILPGNRKLARLTIPDATRSDAGRYECSAGTGNANDQTSIDLQVTDGGYYPRPQPQPQYPQPQYPQPQYPQPQYPQPQYPQPQYPQPQYPSYDPHSQGPVAPQPQPTNDVEDDGTEDDEDENDQEPYVPEDRPAPPTNPPAPVPAEPADDGYGDDGDYPEDYNDTD